MIQTQLSPTADTFKLLANRVNVNGYIQSFEDISLLLPPAPLATNILPSDLFASNAAGWNKSANAVLNVISDTEIEITSNDGNTAYIYKAVSETGVEGKLAFDLDIGTVDNVSAYFDADPTRFYSSGAKQVEDTDTSYLFLQIWPTGAGQSATFSNISFIDNGKVERQDLVFLESWHEKISDKDIVYPYGNVQSLLATDSSTGLSTTAGTFTGKGFYSLFGNWQSENDQVGKGLVWSTMSDINKKKFVSDPENNVYLAEDGELVQVRYRVRVVEGLGAEWDNIDVQADSSLRYSPDATKMVSPQGKQTSVTDLDLSFPIYAGQNSSADSSLLETGAFVAISDYSTRDAASGYKGLCFALPIALVSRRNQGAYHPVFNPNGANEMFRTDSVTGVKWYASDAKVPNSTYDCLILGDSGDTGAFVPNYRGSVSSTYSGRPDDKFYDAIYEGDVIDLRNSSHKQDLQRTLEREANKLIAGEVRGWENSLRLKPAATYTDSAETYADYGFGSTTRIQDSTGAAPLGIDSFSNYDLAGPPFRAFIVGDSGTFYRVQRYYYSAPSAFLYLDVAHGDVRSDFTASSTYTVYYALFDGIESKELLHCDIIGDPANYPQEWFDYGVAGNPLLVGEEGEDYIPDGTSKTFKMSRKVKEALFFLYSTDQGATWALSTAGNTELESVTNSLTSIVGVAHIYMVFYLTEASPFETANNAEVLKMQDYVYALNTDNVGYSDLVSGLINKVSTSTSSPTVVRKPLTNFGFQYPDTGLLLGNSTWQLSHINLGELVTDNPAVKILSYLTRENGKLYMQLLFKEMVHDTPSLTSKDGTISQSYTAGEDYFIVNLDTLYSVHCEVDFTGIFKTGVVFAENGFYDSTFATRYFSVYDGNGWGDDNLFDVVDGISTTTDDNGNTVLIGQKRVELPYMIGDDE